MSTLRNWLPITQLYIMPRSFKEGLAQYPYQRGISDDEHWSAFLWLLDPQHPKSTVLCHILYSLQKTMFSNCNCTGWVQILLDSSVVKLDLLCLIQLQPIQTRSTSISRRWRFSGISQSVKIMKTFALGFTDCWHI